MCNVRQLVILVLSWDCTCCCTAGSHSSLTMAHEMDKTESCRSEQYVFIFILFICYTRVHSMYRYV